MKWYYFDTGFNTGKYNMNFDLSFANNSKEDEVYFRLYRWKPYCLSLGANQNFNSINLEKAKRDNIDVVKRPTGGKAILHAEELTYSVIYPLTNDQSLRNLYCEINKALVKGLILYNGKLSGIELTPDQVDLRSFYKKALSEICFAVSAKSEINYTRKKLVGSAQRKFGWRVLQHGSILCGAYHKKIVHYLNLSDEDRIFFETELENKTIELEKILCCEINYDKLAGCLVEGFEKFFNVNFLNVDEEIFNLSV
jgi:lipoate-protein ligase A